MLLQVIIFKYKYSFKLSIMELTNWQKNRGYLYSLYLGEIYQLNLLTGLLKFQSRELGKGQPALVPDLV